MINRSFRISALLLVCWWNTFTLPAQKPFARLEAHSHSVPDSLTSPKEIAIYLTDSLDSDHEKLRALYVWIAHNIQYDIDLVPAEGSVHGTVEQVLDHVLRHRKGVCAHYAHLLHEMCQATGIKSWVISGYTRDEIGNIAPLSHAWNAVMLDSVIGLLDVTWDAGYSIGDRYFHRFQDKFFLVEPKVFIKDHMPFDPLWQLLDPPVRHQEFMGFKFAGAPLTVKRISSSIVLAQDSLPDLQRYQLEKERVLSADTLNDLTMEHLLVLQERIETLKFNERIERYNQAIDVYNTAVNSFNRYLQHRNAYFRRPKLTDEQVRALIDSAQVPAMEARERLNDLMAETDEPDPNRVFLTNLDELSGRIEQERAFVERYVRTWKPFRGLVFF